MSDKVWRCDVENCRKVLAPGESFICNEHHGFQRCYYCNTPFDSSGPGYPQGIVLTDWCCPPCKKKLKKLRKPST